MTMMTMMTLTMSRKMLEYLISLGQPFGLGCNDNDNDNDNYENNDDNDDNDDVDNVSEDVGIPD